MKNFNIKLLTALLAAALIAGVSIFYACKKEENANNGISKSPPMSAELELLYKQVPTHNFGNVTLVNKDILQFESVEHYEQVYEYLYDQYCEWTRIFLDTYFTGDEDELDDIIEALNFDDQTPLIKFEEQFGFNANSLRSKKAIDERAWLSGGATGLSPSDKIINCPIEQTLSSKYHEVCIRDTICQMREWGFKIIIPISDVQYIAQIRSTSTQDLFNRAGAGGHIGIGSIIIIGPTTEPYNPGGGAEIEQCNNSCGCFEYKNTFFKSNGAKYKFELSYHFKYRWSDDKKKTTVTMKNYKLKENKWTKDYGSYCRLDFSTKLYKNAPVFGDPCVDKGCDGKTGSITMVFSKSKSKTFGSNYMDDIDNSYIACRHRGVEFKYDPRGDEVP